MSLPLNRTSIIDMYLSGDAPSTIARYFDVTIGYVNRNLVGVSRQPTPRIRLLDRSIIRNLYEVELKPIRIIARQFRVDPLALRRLMADWGIKIRGRSDALVIKTDRYIAANNKGTLANPILGDMCRGTDIGKTEIDLYV